MIKGKAQAATEYLATYGWAILIVIIVIAALAYFGIFDVRDLFVSKRCVLSTGITCLDSTIGGSGATFVLENNFGVTINVDEFKLTKKGGDSCSSIPNTGLENNQKILILIPLGCNNGNIGDTFIGEIEVTYTKESGITHNMVGDVRGQILAGGSGVSQVYCQNADDKVLCAGLDIVFGVGYKQACCDDYDLCC